MKMAIAVIATVCMAAGAKTVNELTNPINHRRVTTGKVIGIEGGRVIVGISSGKIYFDPRKVCDPKTNSDADSVVFRSSAYIAGTGDSVEVTWQGPEADPCIVDFKLVTN
jgi:hypothetical protein